MNTIYLIIKQLNDILRDAAIIEDPFPLTSTSKVTDALPHPLMYIPYI